MKKFLKNTGFALLLLVGMCALPFHIYYLMSEKIESLEYEMDILHERINSMNVDSLFNKEWFLFKMALIKVESNFDPNAMNKQSKAAGIYQILPIYIREANRVSRNIFLFTDSCKWDTERSNLMFEVVNAHHNPNKDMFRTIRNHNPGAGNWYRDRVMKEYDFFSKLAESL
jgi:hypothetical protein